MVLWETEFYAISQITGEMQRYRGMFIQANSLQQAMKNARKMKLDYLQMTGDWYPDMEHVQMDKEFYAKLIDPIKMAAMEYDEFNDWLDKAISKEDLLAARSEMEKVPTLEEHIKILDLHIKIKYDDNEEEEEDQKSSDG